MTVYYINPTIKIIDNKFNNIMDNIINEISNLFVNNKNLIIEINYIKSIIDIIQVLIRYLKIYKFFEYGIENINIQIYNKTIDIVINIKIIISKKFFIFISNTWNELYFSSSTNVPIVYNELSNEQQNELNMSIINGNLYFNNNVDLTILNFTKGMILKKESCACIINNCNTTFNYIITIFW